MKIKFLCTFILIHMFTFEGKNIEHCFLGEELKSQFIFETGSDLSAEGAQEALNFHNNARKEVNVEPLTWSVELSEYAQEWADFLAKNNNCEIAHRSWLNREDIKCGENLFWGKGKAFTALDATKAWYNEKQEYTYQTITSDNFFATGHYTQMIWKDTKTVGMGITICENGATIIVANYEPVGNILGEKPY